MDTWLVTLAGHYGNQAVTRVYTVKGTETEAVAYATEVKEMNPDWVIYWEEITQYIQEN